MIVWRITTFPSLDGAGGLYASARWHTKGRRIIYTATSPAGALVEVLAGLDLDSSEIPNDCKLLGIELPDSLPSERTSELPDNWQTDHRVTRAIGDRWLISGETALMYVPSAIVGHAENVLIAPERVTEGSMRLAYEEAFQFDSRLLLPSSATRTDS